MGQIVLAILSTLVASVAVAANSFSALNSVAFGDISGTYTEVVTPSENAEYCGFYLFNATNQMVSISTDGGTTEHFRIEGGETLTARMTTC